MSPSGLSTLTTRRRVHAPVFAALGDETRLSIIAKLCGGQSRSIAELTEGTRMTRQAVTKHLHMLEDAGLVHSTRSGRQSLYEFDPKPIEGVKDYLDLVSVQWDQALSRLKSFVEDR